MVGEHNIPHRCFTMNPFMLSLSSAGIILQEESSKDGLAVDVRAHSAMDIGGSTTEEECVAFPFLALLC
jgi:hypothetical protein